MGNFLGERRVGFPDPTAGVRLMPKLIECPRCGVTKGRIGKARPGICTDCRDTMTPAERRAWIVPKSA